MEGNIRSLTLIGSGSTATAISGRIASGAVNQIIVTARGEKYNYPPTVTTPTVLSEILVVAAAPTPGLVLSPVNTIPGLTVYPAPGLVIKTP